VSEPVQIEATGETVGEARWAALHELERRFPTLNRDAVEFQVVSEGQRGLLGVGYEPARVVATLSSPPDPSEEPVAPVRRSPAPPPADESESAAHVRRLLDTVLDALGLEGDIDIREEGGVVTATVHGPELGLLIGKHGQTIDALQYLTNAIMHRSGDRGVEVVVDAEGYRKRRERTLHEVALRAADRARTTGEPVSLEPMTSVERKIVHTKVQSLSGLTTASEGSEPNRYVVVSLADDEV
jgi:spoIIIJ-associated protein